MTLEVNLTVDDRPVDVVVSEAVLDLRVDGTAEELEGGIGGVVAVGEGPGVTLESVLPIGPSGPPGPAGPPGVPGPGIPVGDEPPDPAVSPLWVDTSEL